MASNDQKSGALALPQQRSRGQSRKAEAKPVISDVGIENAQIVLAKSSTSTSSIQHIVKTVTSPSTSVTQSTSGVMTGGNSFSLDRLISYATLPFCKIVASSYFIAFLRIILLTTRKFISYHVMFYDEN